MTSSLLSPTASAPRFTATTWCQRSTGSVIADRSIPPGSHHDNAHGLSLGHQSAS